MIPDVIVSWPWTCDYPLWRKFIADNRHRFAKVLVAFTTNTDGPTDYRQFVREQIGDIAEYFDVPTDGEWRDRAVNAALDRSTAEWVWFTEQDFLIRDETFWEYLRPTWSEAIVGWLDETPRLHPSCLLVHRHLIDQTSRHFGPGSIDHFARFGQELQGTIYLIPDDGTWEHLQGLSQNHYLIDTGQRNGLFNLPRFHRYLADCLASGVTLHPLWRERAERELALVAA